MQDFSLELKSGQMTALVGPSGEGKTTCASLLLRLYEAQGGEILLDDEPLKSYDHRFLHQKVWSTSSFLLGPQSLVDGVSWAPIELIFPPYRSPDGPGEPGACPLLWLHQR